MLVRLKVHIPPLHGVKILKYKTFNVFICYSLIACILSILNYSFFIFQIPDIPGKGYLRSHPVLGIIVTALCLANVGSSDDSMSVHIYLIKQKHYMQFLRYAFSIVSFLLIALYVSAENTHFTSVIHVIR